MNIRGCLNTIGNTAVSTASTVGNAGKFALEKLVAGVGKVIEIAQRLLPSLVSDTVKAYPKSFSFVAGAATLGGGIYIYNYLNSRNDD